MTTDLTKESNFKQWFCELKLRIRESQIKAAIKVNSELLHLYWDLGRDIITREMDAVWGSGFYSRLSKELKNEFPDMQGFSVTNLNYCKRFYQFYTNYSELQQQITEKFYPQAEGRIQLADNDNDIIHPQLGGEFQINPLFLIPWGHQKLIESRSFNKFYWSRFISMLLII
ncbi:MAG: DUF1016 N-terminal domain-containing protein [Bacteroidales bacterium]|jgi:hypothetical protein|nr:DUF1016 N-terminal domain-containing protein [Bacteroidales bacterium]